MKKGLKKLSSLYAGAVAFSVSDFDNLLTPVKGASGDPKVLTIKIINYSLFFLGVIAIIFIVWGGVQYLISGGDSDKVDKAKKTLLYAVIGIIVIVLAFAILNWAKGALTT